MCFGRCQTDVQFQLTCHDSWEQIKYRLLLLLINKYQLAWLQAARLSERAACAHQESRAKPCRTVWHNNAPGEALEVAGTADKLCLHHSVGQEKQGRCQQRCVTHKYFGVVFIYC